MRIGLISDTHMPTMSTRLHPAVAEVFRGVDMILHAGDLTGVETLELLEEIAPVHAVRGDQDVGLDHLPKRRVIEAGNKRIGLVHGHRPRWIEWPGFTWNMLFGQHFFLAPRFYVNVVRQFAGERVDCIVCGHLHRPYIGHVQGILVVNPGSSYINILDRRTQPGDYVSVGMLEIMNDTLRAAIVPLPERWQEVERERFGVRNA
jgi:putative phosphoesterase